MSSKRKQKDTLSPSSKFKIVHLIENPDGSLRPLRPGDLSIDNHEGVRAAFRMIYEWQKAKHLETKRKEISKDANGESGKIRAFMRG